MKVIIGLVVLVSAVLAEDNGCPPEQITNWEIERLLPHEECGKFYQCTHGQRVEMICPSGLHFNEETSQCDWPSEANCSRNSSTEDYEVAVENVLEVESTSKEYTESTTWTPETTTPQDVELQENGCPVDPTIHWLVAHEEDCVSFYYCVWGNKVLRKCPDYLHFNSMLQICDYPEVAGCASSFNKHLSSRFFMKK